MQKYPWIYHTCRVFFTAVFLFMASSGNALAYGGYHYDHHDYYGFHAQYSNHGHIGTAGYVILGLFGALVLSQILNSDNYRYPGVYHRTYAYQPPPVYYRPALPTVHPAHRGPVYSYGRYEGWDALTNGNAGLALGIFAVQSQQDLESGIPKAGFAIAAAANGELNRGVMAMRRAIKIDPDALNFIPVSQELGLTIDLLIEEYQSALKEMDKYADHSFMIAALSYLIQDYATAKDMIAESDQSQSANNLRILINTAM